MIRIVVPGPPPRKNSRAAVAYLTPKRTKAWRVRLYDAIGNTAAGIESGRWAIVLDVYEAERRHLGDGTSVPHGDVDSCITAILDALQPKWKLPRRKCGRKVLIARGLLDDDARVVTAQIAKHYDKANPRVEITLTEVT
ncbi:MAG: hypothetical protein ACRCZP_19815 [Phycicoccus sp.]